MASFIAYAGSGLLLVMALLCLMASFHNGARSDGSAIVGCWIFFICFLCLAWAFAYLGGI